MKILEKILEEIENLNYYPEGMGGGIEDCGITDRYEACEYGWNEAIEAVIEVINNMDDGKDTNVSANDEWIPVSERLPEEQTEVLCCFDNGEVKSLWQKWDESEDVEEELSSYMTQDYEALRVVAWQPLPAPYKGE